MVLVVREATLQWIHIFENPCGVLFDHIVAALCLAVIDQNLAVLHSAKGQNFVLAVSALPQFINYIINCLVGSVALH